MTKKRISDDLLLSEVTRTVRRSRVALDLTGTLIGFESEKVRKLSEVSQRHVLKEEVERHVDEIMETHSVNPEKRKSVSHHLMTLIQTGFPPLAAVNVIKHILKGEFGKAISNLPLLNIVHTPEAVHGLVMSGMSTLPDSIRQDVVNNRFVKELLRLITNLKNVTTAGDLNSFYINLKQLLSQSSHAVIAFSAFLAAVGAACTAGWTTFSAGALAVLIAIEGLSIGLATPFVTGALVVLGFVETCCVVLMAAGAGGAAAGTGTAFVGFLINKVAKADPEDPLFSDEEFQSHLGDFVNGMQSNHARKFEKQQQKMGNGPTASTDIPPAPEGAPDDLLSEPITFPYDSSASTPEEDLKLVAEGKSYSTNRWQKLAGIN